MIQGSIVALVTPMQKDGSLDLPALKDLVEWHVTQQTDALVIVGTTGESATVTVDEHCRLIALAVEYAAGRLPVIAGAGGNSTTEAIALTKAARQSGAQASLQVVPYYNRPTQEGMYRHFCAIAEAVDLPVILYNVPGRTVADMSNDTVVRLASVSGIVGVKDATGNIGRGIDLIRRLTAIRPDFAVYSGDDSTAMALMFCGARGNISVTANVAPKAMHDLCVAAMAGQVMQARAINEQIITLHEKLFVEPNPVPVKWALAEMNKIGPTLRLPLAPLGAECHDTLRNALINSGVLQ